MTVRRFAFFGDVAKKQPVYGKNQTVSDGNVRDTNTPARRSKAKLKNFYKNGSGVETQLRQSLHRCTVQSLAGRSLIQPPFNYALSVLRAPHFGRQEGI